MTDHLRANPDQIVQVEHHFGVRFPENYRDFLAYDSHHDTPPLVTAT
ncbi:hypothetical protein RM704_00845 [Streptomyces sp. DSM 3412]|uniref:Knr4/Smi1-like domain-containing protein n=1 Tax=Streptomyces gottesmaniae TaxID=3075518 RepID=A0ABU2YP22_9ACTN|nr:SMI1/KNR4 family protein [Streptomyces sp. DSM 3412]MDT0566045.1 hypothetical protein [Streptomyces sp. DSM 3412]